MSMHFSQLKHMKNLVQTAADGGRWERVAMIKYKIRGDELAQIWGAGKEDKIWCCHVCKVLISAGL